MKDVTLIRLPYPVQHRAVGCLVGQAVGDALGAPYEFGLRGRYRSENPEGEKHYYKGGGSFGWEPGEFTDDTQMAVVLARCLLNDPNNYEELFQQFKNWSRSARDVGVATSRALAHPNLEKSRQDRSRDPESSRGNGAVMRVSPVGIAGNKYGLLWTENVAREQATVTHHDPRTVEASVITAVAIAGIISGQFASIDEAVGYAINNHTNVEMRHYFNRLLEPSLKDDDESNFHGDICLRDAVRSIRATSSFADAVEYAANLGSDADTVAAVTGALAGALYGMQEIPVRWATYVHGYVNEQETTLEDLQKLAVQLAGGSWKKRSPDYNGKLEPKVIHSAGVYATNLAGLELAYDEFAVVSLCRTFEDNLRFPYRAQFYLIDEPGANPSLLHVINEAVETINEFIVSGKKVLVHCHAGASRTGLILKAWYMSWEGKTAQEADEWLKDRWEPYRKSNDDFTIALNQVGFQHAVFGYPGHSSVHAS